MRKSGKELLPQLNTSIIQPRLLLGQGHTSCIEWTDIGGGLNKKAKQAGRLLGGYCNRLRKT